MRIFKLLCFGLSVFALGALVGALPQLRIRQDLDEVESRAARLETESSKNAVDTNRLADLTGQIASCRQTVAQFEAQKAETEVKLREIVGSGTVLYEPAPGVSLPVFHGLVDLRPGAALAPLTDREAARWYIPLKITPYTYGAAGTLRYRWFDLKTFEASAPMTPKQTP